MAVVETASKPPETLVDCTPRYYETMGRSIAAAARRCGWTAPYFAWLPAQADGAQRSISRSGEDVRITVKLDRPCGLVAEDMIAGVVHVNTSARPRRGYTTEEVVEDLWVAALGLN